jgi:hypothetical protein
MAKVKAELELQDLTAAVGRWEFRAVRNDRIKVLITDADRAWEVVDAVRSVLREGGEGGSPVVHAGREIYVVAERHPDVQRKVAAFGKLVATVKRLGVEVQAEWNPSFTAFAGPGVEELFHLDADCEDVWEEEVCKRVVGKTPAEVRAEADRRR